MEWERGGYERDASRVVLSNEVFTKRSLKKIQGHLKINH